RGGWFLLSCARRPAATGWRKVAVVQHSLWPARFRAIAVCRYRLSWTAGELITEGKIMKVRNRTNGVAPMQSGTNAQVDVDRLPVDAITGQPLPPREQPGYYPGFSTLSQQAYWDEATRKVVLARVEQVPPIRFFSAEQARLMQAVCDRLMPQDDRDEAHKIAIVNYIDNRLYNRNIDGYRFEDMPPDHEAHLLGLKAIEAIAQHTFHQSFVELEPREQDQVLQTIHDGNPPAAGDI